MNPFKTLRLDAAEGIATLTFLRQETLNSITIEFMDELGAALTQLRADPDIGAVILTGSGRGFCSGLDLNTFAEIGTSLSIEEVRRMLEHWQAVFNALEDLPQATIAAINGITLGGGIELAACCDFRIASTRALFGMPEVKLGIVPDLGGVARLARMVGPARTKEIVMRARNFSAMEALRIGLVHRVAEHGELMGMSRNWADQLSRLPRPAVAQAKRLIARALDDDLTTGLRDAAAAQMELLRTEAFRAAVKKAREEKIEASQ